ncbi:hypothetical protein ACIA6D_41930 [Streptomyces cacaoi]|uniref:hypothetical protein n=1 Tax=Streptomyces cacaoi TaxID=1898 RepID=UPI00374999B3
MATTGGCGEAYQPFGFVTKPLPLIHETKPRQGVCVTPACGFQGNVLGIAGAFGLLEELG